MIIKMASCQGDVREKTRHFSLVFFPHRTQYDGNLENERLGGVVSRSETKREEDQFLAVFLIFLLDMEKNKTKCGKKPRCGKKPGHIYIS